MEEGESEEDARDCVVSRKTIAFWAVIQVKGVLWQPGEAAIQPARLKGPRSEAGQKEERGVRGAGGHRRRGLDARVAKMAGCRGEAAHKVAGQTHQNPAHFSSALF